MAARPPTATFNLAFMVTIEGRFDPSAMERAVAHLVERHEALRTRIVESFQEIDPAPERPLARRDLSHLDAAAANAEARRVLVDEGHRPFDLEREHCARFLLLRLGDESHRLMITVHQVGCGAMDMGSIVFPQLTALYDAYAADREPSLPEQTLQYRDYAVWLIDWLAGAGAPTVERWRKRFEGAKPIDIALDGARSSPALVEAETVHFELPGRVAEAFDVFTRDRQVPAAALVNAAISGAFAKRSGQSDFVLGIVTDMHTVRPELGAVLGRFMNPVPCRIDASGDLTGLELALRARASLLEAYRHRIVPTEIALDHPSALECPLMRVMVNVMSQLPGTGPSFGGVQTSCEAYQPDECKNEMVFSVERSPTGWNGYVRAMKALWSRETIARIASDFVEATSAIVTAPEAKLGFGR